MSSHNKLYEIFNADHTLPDPGDAATIRVDRDLAVLHLVSGSDAETRTLADPKRAGNRLTLFMVTDGGGDITITASSPINQAGDTSLVFADVHDMVDLVSVKDVVKSGDTAAAYRWAIAGEAGTINVSAFGDDDALLFGDGADAGALWSTGDASNHSFVLFVDNTGQQVHITDKAARGTDWGRSAGTHPELAIHSNTTPITDYLAIGNHDGTTASIDVVGGTTLSLDIAGTAYAGVNVQGLFCGTFVVAGSTAGTDQLTLKSTGTAPTGTGANVGHLYADFENDDDELFWLSGTGGTATQLTT